MVSIMITKKARKLVTWSLRPKKITPMAKYRKTLREVKKKLYSDDEKRILGTDVGVTSRASNVPCIWALRIWPAKLLRDTDK